MALPILDGNQTAATLSTIITGGAHIPAHTVVSLGSQAISDITSGVSGSVVSISNFPSTQTIAGTVTANLTYENLYALGVIDDADKLNCNVNAIGGNDPAGWLKSNGGDVPISGTVTVGNSVTIGSLPSGSLTTRFGSVTTANTAQITSAVTNASRKYLLAQNISAGTVTIGIGFSPTTTQGIQLSAGGGLTFDAFCPTGAVYWLGAVTGAAFTILEG